MDLKNENLLSVSQIAEKLGIARTSVYRLLDNEENPIPSYRIGGFKFALSEVQEWLETQRVTRIEARKIVLFFLKRCKNRGVL